VSQRHSNLVLAQKGIKQILAKRDKHKAADSSTEQQVCQQKSGTMDDEKR
jgi:hypothetical protein